MTALPYLLAVAPLGAWAWDELRIDANIKRASSRSCKNIGAHSRRKVGGASIGGGFTTISCNLEANGGNGTGSAV